MQITKIQGECEWIDCGEPATTIAIGRTWFENPGHPLGLFCEAHADKVAGESNPEYIVECPNCSCHFGVN